ESAKYSLLVPPDLDRRLKKVAETRGVTLSQVLRELIELALDIEEKPLTGAAEGNEGRAGRPGGGYVVRFNDTTRAVLEHAADLRNVAPSDLIQELVTENLAGTVQKAEGTRAGLEEVVRRMPRRSGLRNSGGTLITSSKRD